MAKKSKKLPTPQEILEFIQSSGAKTSKRDIARAFALKGMDRVWLKDQLKKMAAEGTIDRGRKKAMRAGGTLPPILMVQVSPDLSEEGEVILIPVDPYPDSRPIFLIDEAGKVKPKEHLLVRLKLHKQGYYIAHILKKILQKRPQWVGMVTSSRGQLCVTPCDRRRQSETTPLEPHPKAKEGDIVLVNSTQRQAKVVQILGTFKDPRVISLISLYEQTIPHEFPEAVLQEAEAASHLSLEGREDLRSIPFVTIDGEDARDFDDAVWAHEDPDQGWHLMVAIADVAFYVKPESLLDQEATLRGNSVYFPDQVVPMLPEVLSNGVCSLRPREDKACFAVHLWLDTKGRLKKSSFVRGVMRSVERLTYGQVQRAIEGEVDEKTRPLLATVIKPLYGAYGLLQKARDHRGTLDLEVGEKQVILNEQGYIQDICVRQRLESHRLIEEFMILANVAAAQQLEALKAPCLYRVHDAPAPAKIFAFREVVEGLGLSFPQSQAPTPQTFMHLLKAVQGSPHQALVNHLTLRTQAQALYQPENIGHFGLNLKKYSHFTSPIRRYADIITHRSLITALALGQDGLPKTADLTVIGEQTSLTERRAAAAERSALERYVTIYLKAKEGETFEGRVNGVTSFGLFVTLDHSGADGLLPVAALPGDYYVYEENKHRLIGRRTRKSYTLGDALLVRLREVDTLTNSISLDLVEPTSQGKKPFKKNLGEEESPSPPGSLNMLRPAPRHDEDCVKAHIWLTGSP